MRLGYQLIKIISRFMQEQGYKTLLPGPELEFMSAAVQGRARDANSLVMAVKYAPHSVPRDNVSILKQIGNAPPLTGNFPTLNSKPSSPIYTAFSTTSNLTNFAIRRRVLGILLRKLEAGSPETGKTGWRVKSILPDRSRLMWASG